MKNLLNILKNLKTAEKKAKLSFTKAGVWEYFYRYQIKDIVSVGVVTKDHWIWQMICYQIDIYRLALGMEACPKQVALLKEAANNLTAMFKFVFREAKVGLNYSDKHAHMAKFRTPLLRYQPDNAPEVVAICPRAVRKGLYRASHMFFQIMDEEKMAVAHKMSEAEKLSLDNLYEFCRLMERAGRMAQEGTIDSTKSGDAPVIELFEAMERVKLMSRRGKFKLAFNFTDHEVKVDINKRESTVKPVTDLGYEYKISDFFDVVRSEALDDAIDEDYRKKILDLKQDLPEDEKAICMEMAEKSVYADAIRLAMQNYRTLQETRNNALAQGLRDSGKNEEAAAAGAEIIKNKIKAGYSKLTDQVRIILRKLDNVDKVRLILGVTLKYQAKESTRPSSFVGIILQEEFFEYINFLRKGDAKLEETRDDLAYCDAEDGETVTFTNGLVRGRRIFSLEHNAIPDGEYTVHKDEHHAWVSRNVKEYVASKIDTTVKSLVFQTQTCRKGEMDINALKNAISGAKEVTLVPFMTDPRNGKDLHDIVLADGKIVAHFINKVATMIRDKDGHMVPKKVQARVNGQPAFKKNIVGKDVPLMVTEYRPNVVLNRFYARKAGSVAFCHPLVFKDANKHTSESLFVALEDTREVPQAELNKMIAEADVAKVFDAPAQPKRKTSNRLAALMAKAIADEEPAADVSAEAVPAAVKVEQKKAPVKKQTAADRLAALRTRAAASDDLF